MENNIYRPKKRSSFKGYFITIFLAIFVVVFVNKYLFFSIKVPSKSMYPTIKVGDRINTFIIHNQGSLKRGDIVVFYSKELNDTLIKRLIGLPGEKVTVAPDGTLYINDIKLNEPYVSSQSNKPGEFKVPNNSYLFLGDNRGDSYDSRYWANPYISYEDIQGKAKFIYYPFNRIGNLK
jgi:signal peptidase I